MIYQIKCLLTCNYRVNRILPLKRNGSTIAEPHESVVEDTEFIARELEILPKSHL